jgi:hypothetical protein
VPRNKEEHGKNSARESTNEYRILNAKPVSPEFLATSIREPAVKLCPSSAIPAATVNVAAVATVFSSVTSDPGNPATATQEFETKKQRNNYFRSVNTIINDGPAARPEWAKVPITFTEEDFRLKSAIHNDAMVIEVNIAGWVIGKVLFDNGSSADILFLKTFEKMNLSQHMLDPPAYPL